MLLIHTEECAAQDSFCLCSSFSVPNAFEWHNFPGRHDFSITFFSRLRPLINFEYMLHNRPQSHYNRSPCLNEFYPRVIGAFIFCACSFVMLYRSVFARRNRIFFWNMTSLGIHPRMILEYNHTISIAWILDPCVCVCKDHITVNHERIWTGILSHCTFAAFEYWTKPQSHSVFWWMGKVTTDHALSSRWFHTSCKLSGMYWSTTRICSSLLFWAPVNYFYASCSERILIPGLCKGILLSVVSRFDSCSSTSFLNMSCNSVKGGT